MKKRLTKSNDNRWFSGVIGGIGEYFGLDDQIINIIRIIYIALVVMGVGSPILLYIVLAVIMPRDYSGQKDYQRSSHEKTWETHSSYYEPRGHHFGSTGRKIKEAEAVKDEKDDWSDF
ncbi:PspC domain-containing protein [Lactovum miscens]|uniref:Phage shock protein PspC (Stress-responsive transcriptional regulator) n=1 Tax=Lactovum miscens TaxID=190387 RepID=A0A841C7Y4_9LACT|nr:PspC domain-containing protein [Lactovum miscens]MBB5887509.1 phage shock protein PspC (stress-responsive transcriptional regulator) [Lactovum miscens]